MARVETEPVIVNPQQEVRPSLLSLWQNGLISNRELPNLAPTLRAFLQDNGLSTHTSYFSAILDYFKATDGVFASNVDSCGYKYLGKSRYRVDPEIMGGKLTELAQVIREQQEKGYPPRSEEERRLQQERLLRLPTRNGNRQLLLTEAYEILFKTAVAYFLNNGFRQEVEDLAQEALIRVRPYLEGQREARSADFGHFCCGFFAKVQYNVGQESLRKRQREARLLNAVANQTRVKESLGEFVSSLQRPFPDLPDLQEEIKKLRPQAQELLRLRVQGVYTWQQIGRILGIPEARARVSFSRILDKLNPQRQKRIMRSYTDEKLLEKYFILRAETLRLNGRIPSFSDFEKAPKRGATPSVSTFGRRFGNGSWPVARQKLETLILISNS